MGTFPKKIITKFSHSFKINSLNIYAVTIKARCSRNEDLRVEIDNMYFREIPQSKNEQLFNIPPSWNGTLLEGLEKTVVFIMPLDKGDHILTFIPRSRAEVVSIDISKVNKKERDLSFIINEQAEDGDRRPWYTFILVNLPLEKVRASARVSWHFLDGDDVQVIIDGQIQKNKKSIYGKNWIWRSTPFNMVRQSLKDTKEFVINLPIGTHYIEFWADRTPTLQHVSFNIGDFIPKRVPTKDDPKWTGDFRDDTEQMLLARVLFGEARFTLIPDEARIAICWVIKNRINGSNRKNTLHDVILEDKQFSSFNITDANNDDIKNPHHSKNVIELEAWDNAYEIAGRFLNNEYKEDPTKGANHYFDDSKGTPPWGRGKDTTLDISFTGPEGNKSTFHFLKL